MRVFVILESNQNLMVYISNCYIVIVVTISDMETFQAIQVETMTMKDSQLEQ